MAISYPTTLWDLLSRAAEKFPGKGLIIHDSNIGPPSRITYAQLHQSAKVSLEIRLPKLLKHGEYLRRKGLVVGDKIVVTYFESHQENILWCWSVIAAGGIPAILSPLSFDKTTLTGQLQNVDKLFNSPIVVTTPQLATRFQCVPSLRVHNTRQICEMPLAFNGFSYEDSLFQTTSNDFTELAVLLFTSGSTGYAKAVEFTHSQLLASVKSKVAFHGHNEDTRYFSWISFDHSANFCEMHLCSMYVGSDQYHSATADIVGHPANFFNVIGTNGIGYAFAPSFFLAAATKSFLAQKSTVPFLDFSKLSALMCGGEANRTANIQAADGILTRYGAPPNSIRIAYGLSETCSASFYNTNAPAFDLRKGNNFASVGQPLSTGIQYRVVDDFNVSVPTSTVGSVQLRGEIVFTRYHNNETATRECMTADGWFHTGDLGSVDDEGYLSIFGRSKEVIIINGNNYSSFELENCIESDNAQAITPTYTATFGVWDEKTDTESVVVLFNPNKLAETKQLVQSTILGIQKSVVRFCLKNPIDILPLPIELLPKSTLGKLSRAHLKKQYLAGSFDHFRVSLYNTAPKDYAANCGSEINGKSINGANTIQKSTGINGLNCSSDIHSNNVANDVNGTNNGNGVDCFNGVNGSNSSNGTENINRVNGNKILNNSLKANDVIQKSTNNCGLTTEMQVTIARILSEETKVPSNSMYSGYAISQLGIDSLGYMRIKKSLEEAFGMEDVIPMSLILQASSIKEIENGLLSIGTVPPVYKAIVPLSTTGSKTPLFLLHPGSGEVLCWLTILKYLPDRPIYAVRAKGLHKADGWFKTLDEMISCYLDELRQYQPHGPYSMLGFCLGGTIAFEMAKRLEAEGEEIVFLAGIDNPPDLRHLRVLEDFRKILTEVLPQLGVITVEQMQEFNAEHDENTHFEDLYRALVKKFGESILVPFDITLPGLIQRARVDWSMRGIFRDYIPSGKVSKFDVFWVPPMEALNATEDEWRHKYLGEWDTFSETKVNYYKCIGNHLNVMQGEENVQCFQKELNKALVLRNI